MIHSLTPPRIPTRPSPPLAGGEGATETLGIGAKGLRSRPYCFDPSPTASPHRHPLQTGRAMLAGETEQGGEPKSIAPILLSSPSSSPLPPAPPSKQGGQEPGERERDGERGRRRTHATSSEQAPPPPTQKGGRWLLPLPKDVLL